MDDGNPGNATPIAVPADTESITDTLTTDASVLPSPVITEASASAPTETVAPLPPATETPVVMLTPTDVSQVLPPAIFCLNFNDERIADECGAKLVKNSGDKFVSDRFKNHKSAFDFKGKEWLQTTNIPLDGTPISIKLWLSAKEEKKDSLMTILEQDWRGLSEEQDSSHLYIGLQTEKKDYYVIFVYSGGGKTYTLIEEWEKHWFKKWHMLSFVYDGQALSAYLDNTLIATTAEPVTGPEAIGTGDLFIGRGSQADHKTFLKGDFDELVIYQGTISQAEIETLWDAESVN